jgi:hypothetical protein
VRNADLRLIFCHAVCHVNTLPRALSKAPRTRRFADKPLNRVHQPDDRHFKRITVTDESELSLFVPLDTRPVDVVLKEVQT